MSGRRRPCRGGGFTLIELMVAVAVVALLAAIAVPSYSAYLVRGKRAEAKAVLLQAAEFMERNYTQAGCYNFTAAADCATPGGTSATTLPTTQAPATGKGNYVIGLTALSAQGYTLSATPCGTTGVTCTAPADTSYTDPDCGTLTLDSTGLRGANGNLAAADCWRR